MADPTDEELRDYRDEAESSRDDPLSGTATRPGQQRAKILSVRLTPEEFDELNKFASALDMPASAMVRGWILQQLRDSPESPLTTVERIAHELQQLRRQLAA